MKNLLIIYPHWVPSNLAGVHRPRLIANFLSELGWHPIILTVLPEFYEEKPDPDIAKTASEKIEVIYTKAYSVTRPRIIGDIGVRAFPFLLNKALELIATRKIDFIWIPIPSFYTALLGRILYNRTKVPYGIDYIDPWVRDIHNRNNFRAMLSIFTARLLEPIAVKHASLISGVSTSYYEPVLHRNFKNKHIAHIGMPYGFDPSDHNISLPNIVRPWDNIGDIEPIVYAGAFLPNSHLFVNCLFKAVRELMVRGMWCRKKRFFFLGTGAYLGTSIADYAEQYGIKDVVTEVRERYPYLHVLNFLAVSSAVLVVGSTEKHYTASKTYQALLSKRPVIAIFHEESSAVNVLEECKANNLLIKYNEKLSSDQLIKKIEQKLLLLLSNDLEWSPVMKELDKYSAKASAHTLVDKINELT